MKVAKGQDPYNVIGNYIREHLTVIEDMIAVIRINDSITNELFLVDWDEEGYFVWHNDWWEGEENVELIDFFPVSDSERLPEPENMENDLISRQAAIDALWEIRQEEISDGRRFHNHCSLSTAVDVIKDLPSAQPEPCKDAVSRQAAIDTDGLDEEIRCEMCRNPMHTDRGCDGNCKYDEKLYEKIMQVLDERIKPLPSAQPEIIRCKDCKWYGRADKRRFYRGMDCLQKRIDTIIPDKDFCSRAERREE